MSVGVHSFPFHSHREKEFPVYSNLKQVESIKQFQILCPDCVELGSSTSRRSWVYLCGLTTDFNSPFEQENRELLDTIGKTLDLKILAVQPTKTNEAFDNKLWWPQSSEEEIRETYQAIQNQIRGKEICGYIGFSNGGFFLLRLAQTETLSVPIIAIGAGGYPNKIEAKNKIVLLIGKQDEYHYDSAKLFEQKTKGSSLDVSLIEYEEGHVIPNDLLQKTVKELDE